MSRAIMIVDDEPGMVKLYGLMLERVGYSVISAYSAYEAVEKMKDTQPDMFILDYMMPGMNGVELIEHIRSNGHTSNIPIIMLSARTDKELVEEAIEAGANHFIHKPILRADLIEVVNQYMV